MRPCATAFSFGDAPSTRYYVCLLTGAADPVKAGVLLRA
jgi:hypothetical protein